VIRHVNSFPHPPRDPARQLSLTLPVSGFINVWSVFSCEFFFHSFCNNFSPELSGGGRLFASGSSPRPRVTSSWGGVVGGFGGCGLFFGVFLVVGLFGCVVFFLLGVRVLFIKRFPPMTSRKRHAGYESHCLFGIFFWCFPLQLRE